MKRLPVFVLFLGILLGLGLGILIGWVLYPVHYVDTPPSALRAGYKDQYLLLIASAYAADHNLDRARQRLDTLGYPDALQAVDALAQDLAANGKDASMVAVLANDIRIGRPGNSILLPMPTASSPLAGVEFPVQEIPYPSGWPADLLYPDQFTVVDMNTGVLPEQDRTGWAAKLRYAGDVKSAADLLSSFFVDKGWQVVERTDLDMGGILVMLKKNNTSNGILVLDSDIHDTQSTNIVATIFP
jgi:hypothetical protein